MTQDEHIQRIDPRIREKAKAVLRDLAGHGWQPVIASSWRSIEEQKEKVKDGYSNIYFSYHCHTLNGKKAALAFDVIDRRWGWGISQDHLFWKHLGSSLKAHGMEWGGDWRKKDVAHGQVKGISLAQAKKESGL